MSTKVLATLHSHVAVSRTHDCSIGDCRRSKFINIRGAMWPSPRKGTNRQRHETPQFLRRRAMLARPRRPRRLLEEAPSEAALASPSCFPRVSRCSGRGRGSIIHTASARLRARRWSSAVVCQPGGRRKGGAERVQSAASPQAPPGGWLGPFGFFRLVTYTFLAGGIPAVLKKHSPMRTVLGLAEECCWHYCWHSWPRLGLVLAGSVGSKRASSCKDGPADRTPPGQSLTQQSRAEPEKSRRQFHFPDATAAFAAFAQLGASPDGFAASSPAVKDDAAGALFASL